ncbi:hypothetical protein ACHAXS_000094 [Conticribra weissflogii]
MAILSIMVRSQNICKNSVMLLVLRINLCLTPVCSAQGSSFIVFDTTKTIQKRDKLLNQLLCTISVFDILGSIAYSLTTLPIPESY